MKCVGSNILTLFDTLCLSIVSCFYVDLLYLHTYLYSYTTTWNIHIYRLNVMYMLPLMPQNQHFHIVSWKCMFNFYFKYFVDDTIAPTFKDTLHKKLPNTICSRLQRIFYNDKEYRTNSFEFNIFLIICIIFNIFLHNYKNQMSQYARYVGKPDIRLIPLSTLLYFHIH